MPDPSVYERIADRYLAASRPVAGAFQEAAMFAVYHSFESIGCAWLRQIGLVAHPLSHSEKLRRFVLNSRPYRFNMQAAQVAGLVQGMRNNVLYPISDGAGGFVAPDFRYSPSNARDLIAKVGRVVALVKKEL